MVDVHNTGFAQITGSIVNSALNGAYRIRVRNNFAYVAALSASAMSAIDISDGLVADARHLAAASNVAIEIDGERVPRVPGVTMQQAIASGEEYELIVTARSIDTAAFSAEFGLELTEIGRVVAGAPQVVLLENGREIATPAGGFDHFENR